MAAGVWRAAPAAWKTLGGGSSLAPRRFFSTNPSKAELPSVALRRRLAAAVSGDRPRPPLIQGVERGALPDAADRDASGRHKFHKKHRSSPATGSPLDVAAVPVAPLSISQSFKNISYSPWRMNLLAKQLRGLTVPEAIGQGKFSAKKGGAIAKSLIEKASDVAFRNHGVARESLFVDTLFVTQGPGRKRIKMMGRGRTGLSFIRSSHLHLTISAIDFEKRVGEAPNGSQRRRWQRLAEEAASAQAALQRGDGAPEPATDGRLADLDPL